MAMVHMSIPKMSGGQEVRGKLEIFNIYIIKQIKMRKIKILGSIITLIIIFSGCEKVKDPTGQRDVGVIPVISEINPGIFDSKDLNKSYVVFKLDLVSGQQADKVVIEGSYNNDYKRIPLAEVTSFPATVKIISGDVIQKLGIAAASVVNGDIFTLEMVTTAKGVTTRSTAILRVVVSCAYQNSLAIGSYHSVSSDWNSEGDITITADHANPYKVYVTGLEEMEGLIEDSGPLVMNIDPATYNVSVPSKILSSDAWGYGSIKYAGDGVYNSCDGSYVMHFEISLDATGSLGINTFKFTRNVK
jgi:hypothetical protein